MELKKIKTAYCEIKEAQCLIEGKALDVTNIVIGDGNGEIPNLSKDMTSLVNQKLKLAVEVDDSKLPKYKFTAVLPNDVEEFQMREIGIIDKEGKLLYVSQMDGSSTNLLNSGISKQIRIQIQFTPAEGINIIVIDPASSTASVDYVNEKIDEKIGDIDFSSFEVKTNKGQANGYCPLDKDEHVPKKHLPEINNTFIKSYHNVVYGVAKTVAFGGDYSTFTAVDISSYADGTYRVFAKTSSAIIPKTYTEGATAPTNPSVGDVLKYIPAEPAEGEEQTACYKEYVTVTVPATEDGAEETTTNEWQVVELTELATIKTADGTLSEVLSAVQYSTEEPLQEVDLHTETSYADSIGQIQSGKLPLIPFNFTNPNWSDYVAVTANTTCKYSRDGVFHPTAVAKIVLTEADGTVTEFPAKLELKLKAGDKFTSTVAGKFYFYY